MTCKRCGYDKVWTSPLGYMYCNNCGEDLGKSAVLPPALKAQSELADNVAFAAASVGMQQRPPLSLADMEKEIGKAMEKVQKAVSALGYTQPEPQPAPLKVGDVVWSKATIDQIYGGGELILRGRWHTSLEGKTILRDPPQAAQGAKSEWIYLDAKATADPVKQAQDGSLMYTRAYVDELTATHKAEMAKLKDNYARLSHVYNKSEVNIGNARYQFEQAVEERDTWKRKALNAEAALRVERGRRGAK